MTGGCRPFVLLTTMLAIALGALATLGVSLMGRLDMPRITLLLLSATCLSAALAFSWAVLRRQAGMADAAQHYLDLVSRLEHHDFNDVNCASKLPHVDPRNRWGALLQRVLDRFVEFSQRASDAEQTRVRAEVRARRMNTDRERISEILGSLPNPVLAIDHYDELVLTNPSAEKLFELSADNAEQRALSNLVRCEQLVDLLTDTRRHKSSVQRTGEIELVDPQGTAHWYRVCCRSLALNGEGESESPASGGAVAVLSDISAQKAIQKRNAEFVSSVSHEMKTPLSGIKAYVELLVDGDAEDEQTREEFLDVINSQADRLQRLIDNLLNLARIEAGVVNVNKEARSLNDILEEAQGVVQPSAEQKQIELVDDLSPLYLGVFADRDMLLQTAINLLSNAIKYTAAPGRVTLRSRLADSTVVLEVEDTGVGLSEEDCARVFEKFYRVKKDRQMASGTGLGLPLAKHIVEDVHGGQLTVHSELGRGSVFRVTLPGVGRLSG